MVRFIQPNQTLPLRSLVLRNGQPEADCVFIEDKAPTTFHLGYFSETEQLVCVLTCQLDKHGKLNGTTYRLRGMATHPDHLRKGYGKALVEAAEVHLRTQLGARYLWLNAREIAFPFYSALGYEFMSDMFDIAGIGPHKEMFKLL